MLNKTRGIKTFAGKTARYWLLKGILLNSVPAAGELKIEIPEIPMVLIHQWLQDAENLPHDDSEYATIHPMASYIKNVWLHTQLFCVPDTKAHLRFENVMAYWFGLLLHCACVEKYTLRLCSASKADKKHTILFPEFEIFRSEDRDMDPPSQLIDCADRVIHFKYKLSEGKADKNRASCNDHYTIMNTAYGDTQHKICYSGLIKSSLSYSANSEAMHLSRKILSISWKN